MSGEPKVTIEGRVRVRDNKRWKPRYCIVTKASPVANSLQVHLHKEAKGGNHAASQQGLNHDSKRGTLSKNARTTVALDNFLGVQSGFPLDKETFTLAIFCQDSCVVLALDNRETLALWEARLRLSMPEVCHFDAQLVKVPPYGKTQLGPCRLHIQDHQFSITTLTAQGPQVVHSWKIQELRRFGKLDENLYGFEGGSRSGKGEGAHVLMLEDVSGLEGTFQVAAQGLLNRQKKSVYNALMADLVGLRERITSIHSLNSTSSMTLAASVASSVYGGGSTLRRQVGSTCHCHCGSIASPNISVSRTDQQANTGIGSIITGSAPSVGQMADYGDGSPPSAPPSLSGLPTSSASTPVPPAAGIQSTSQPPQHGRQPSTASQDTTDSLLNLESQASTAKLCDRSSLCSESSGTGSCNGSVGVRSDESSDYDVPKHLAGGGTAAEGSPATSASSSAACTTVMSCSSPTSCYDQPKNLTSVTSALKCPCQPFASGSPACSDHPDSLLNYDIPAQFVNSSCSDYDTPKAVADSLWAASLPSYPGSHNGTGQHIGPMMEYETIKALTQTSASAGGHVFSSFNTAGHLQTRERLLHNGSPTPAAGAADAKTRLLFSQRQEQNSGRLASVRSDHGEPTGQRPRQVYDEVKNNAPQYNLPPMNGSIPQIPQPAFNLSDLPPPNFDSNDFDNVAYTPQFTPTFTNRMVPTMPGQLGNISMSSASQHLPNRRLLNDGMSAPPPALVDANCTNEAIDYELNAQFMQSLHLQYPLLEDGHLQNGSTSSGKGLAASTSVPPAPSIV